MQIPPWPHFPGAKDEARAAFPGASEAVRARPNLQNENPPGSATPGQPRDLACPTAPNTPSVCKSEFPKLSNRESATLRFAALPRGYFGAILTDVSSRFETWSDKGKGRSAERHYPTLSFDELKALDVGALAARDCVLFQWATWPTLPRALELIAHWGFIYSTCGFDWTKADTSQLDMFREDADGRMGNGYWTRSNTEPCLLAVRGNPKRLNAAANPDRTKR
jgi:MT-A70 protein